MAYAPARLYQGQPGTSEATAYTSTGVSTIVREAVVANVTASAATFEMSFVASGGTAGATNRVVPTVSVPAYSVVTFTFYQVLASGGFISAKAGTASALTVTISGVTF